MTFKVYKASDFDFEEIIIFNTLEELKNYQLKSESSLIINFTDSTICIYDDYME